MEHYRVLVFWFALLPHPPAALHHGSALHSTRSKGKASSTAISSTGALCMIWMPCNYSQDSNEAVKSQQHKSRLRAMPAALKGHGAFQISELPLENFNWNTTWRWISNSVGWKNLTNPNLKIWDGCSAHESYATTLFIRTSAIFVSHLSCTHTVFEYGATVFVWAKCCIMSHNPCVPLGVHLVFFCYTGTQSTDLRGKWNTS